MQERTTSPRVNESPVGYTLTQQAELIRGAVAAVTKHVGDLERRLGKQPAEKDLGHPERAVGGPGDILANAYDELIRADHLLERMVEYIGTPGEGPSAAIGGSGGSVGNSRW